MRRKRQVLSRQDQIKHAKELSQHLLRLNDFRFTNKIALYLANDGEIDPSFVIIHAWNMGKQVYLPVLSPLKNQLYFAPYFPDSKMKTNCFGICEPACHPRHWICARQIDVLFLPLVAFDENGNRTGMGGGYYDRSLAYLSTRQKIKKPKLIGLAHSLQQCDGINSDPWDIPLNMVVTEKRVIRI